MKENKFGLRLYEEIRRRGLLFVLTSELDYAGIQRLKGANREEVVRMFFGLGYSTLQVLKSAPVKEVVDHLAMRQAARRSPAPVMFFM